MLAYLFVIFAVVVRLLPHAGLWNFTPVGAALLFFGARQPRKQMWIPVALLVASDFVLSLAVYHYPMMPDLFATWAWYGAAILMGGLLRDNAKPARVLGAALGASLSFFVISNFAVWLESTHFPQLGVVYPQTLDGLITCFAAAVPFFRNTLA